VPPVLAQMRAPSPNHPQQDKKLQLYDFQGVKQREWSLDAVIRYIKVGAVCVCGGGGACTCV